MPWTAPIYDQRAITSDPQLICMSSMEGLDGNGKRSEASCTCMTEQGTRYAFRSLSAAPSRATGLSTTRTSSSATCNPVRACPAPHRRNLLLDPSRPWRQVATR